MLPATAPAVASCRITTTPPFSHIMKLSKQHSMYESDHTRFIAELKAKNPGIEQGQKEGRALLWDKAPTPLAEQDRIAEARVKQQAYVYQNKL
jgi:hypothetical protein